MCATATLIINIKKPARIGVIVEQSCYLVLEREEPEPEHYLVDAPNCWNLLINELCFLLHLPNPSTNWTFFR